MRTSRGIGQPQQAHRDAREADHVVWHHHFSAVRAPGDSVRDLLPGGDAPEEHSAVEPGTTGGVLDTRIGEGAARVGSDPSAATCLVPAAVPLVTQSVVLSSNGLIAGKRTELLNGSMA